MFIKITKAGNHEYVQLVQSYRDGGQVRHKVVAKLGRVDEIEGNPSFQRIAMRLAEISKAPQKGKNMQAFSEAEIVNWGWLVYRKLWEQLGIDVILEKLGQNRKYQFNVDQTSFLMAVQHLLDPRSKLGTFEHQERYLGLGEVGLNHLYRSLDFLCEHKETLEESLFQTDRHLFNMRVDVVFYDVTTFSFESVKKDSLRDFGFSKNGKFNEVQVVMGLLIDSEGRPIGYELFPGNTFDGKTLEAALEAMEKRFGIRRVIVVADRGINSKLNLKRISEKGYEYIVASRIKSLKNSVQEEILSDDGYREICLPWEENKETVRYKVINYLNRFREGKQTYELEEQLIVTYSSRRARKDKSDRERLVEKAQRLLQSQSSIKASNKRGGKKFLKETADSQVSWELDQAAIEKDARFDGYYGIQTNAKKLTVNAILAAHHTLWKIEESFRIMKSTLEVQPVFHWTEKRIKGHFVVCFLAFLLERTLEYQLRQANIEASPRDIQESLNTLTFSLVNIDDKSYLIKNKATEISKKILRLLKISSIPNMMPIEDFKQYIK